MRNDLSLAALFGAAGILATAVAAHAQSPSGDWPSFGPTRTMFWDGRSTKSYSIRADQLRSIAYSTPPPTVQPYWVVLPLSASKPAGVTTLFRSFAKAAPPLA